MVSESEIFDDRWPDDESALKPQQVVMPSGAPTQVSGQLPSRSVSGKAMSVLLQGAGAVFLLMIVGFFVLAVVVRLSGGSFGMQGGCEQVVVQKGPAESKIAILSLDGVIDSDDYFGEAANKFLGALEGATSDQAVKALVIEVNSPGGSATYSDVIHHKLEAVKLPKVVLMGDIAASGGYYVSVACEHIMAHPTTITGSIGVLMEMIHVEELMSKLGVGVLTVKSGEHKDLGNPFRAPTEEERQIFQQAVNEIHHRFVGIVAKGRKMKEEEVLPLATGRIFTARAALEYRLIDSIGYREDAIEKAKELAGLVDATVVEFRSKPGLRDLLGLSSRQGGAEFPWLELLYPRGAQFLYLPARE